MTAAARKIDSRSDTTPKPSAVDVFRERAEARAILVNACIYDLQDAVDGLQADAERTGLAAEIGLDAVQKMLADAFAIVPKFSLRRENCHDVVTIPKPRGAATSTLQAADYLIRQKDSARLKAWLAKHTRAERLAIIKHLHRAKP
jgi:hypothetical protein